MARRIEPNFHGPEVLVAAFVALAAQAVFIAIFTAGESTPLKADISDENSKPMSVAIADASWANRSLPSRGTA